MLLAIVSNGLVLYGSSVYSVPVHAQKISRGSVATCLRMDGIFNYHFTTKSVSERILEMGQHLAKLETSIVALFPDML